MDKRSRNLAIALYSTLLGTVLLSIVGVTLYLCHTIANGTATLMLAISAVALVGGGVLFWVARSESSKGYSSLE
ncbi:hypothetical protein KIPB_014216 [Kipferlia bialata]|uniref:Uncharacterized protein n=1 Tax=Kipferlia bialata TaxID=797122 RepID=A0A9K3DA71_9EUKA|nr:hypothetical protein KIPB_014216 [Kipferlia bialata]|eukprot:g14216.t1